MADTVVATATVNATVNATAATSSGGCLRQIAELPGPRPWPLIGNMFQLRPRHFHLDVEAWCRTHGPLLQMRLGPQTVLVVSDHQLVSAVLRDRPDGYRRPAITESIAKEMKGRPGLFLEEGAAWRAQRRMVMAALAPHAVKAYFPALVKVAQRLQHRWQHAAGANTHIDLAEDLKRYSVDIVAGLAFGAEVNTLEGGEDILQRHMDLILPAVSRRSLSLFPYWRYLKLPADRQLDRSIAALNHAIDELVVQARAHLAADPARRAQPANLLEAMICAADDDAATPTPHGLDEDAIAGNVTTMLLAGEDTTSHTLAWMLYLLQQNPAALHKARGEVLRVAPQTAAFTIEQMDALDYIDACAQEAMRLKPVAPYIPLEALRDNVVGDVAVPAGSLLWLVMRNDSVSEQHVAHAASFAPERWLPNAAQETEAINKQLSMPFGAGLRTCPGRYLALLEIKIATAMLLNSFDIAAIDTADGGEPQELSGFTMSPVGLRMQLRPRAAG